MFAFRTPFYAAGVSLLRAKDEREGGWSEGMHPSRAAGGAAFSRELGPDCTPPSMPLLLDDVAHVLDVVGHRLEAVAVVLQRGVPQLVKEFLVNAVHQH